MLTQDCRKSSEREIRCISDSTSCVLLQMVMEEEFDAEEEDVTNAWYEALSNCLLADLLYRLSRGEVLSDAQTVLLLFLDPEEEDDSQEQIRQIRERIDKDTLDKIAEETDLPIDYVEWLMGVDPASQISSSNVWYK